jgi:uncharacterized membrane protein (DUF485 family)
MYVFEDLFQSHGHLSIQKGTLYFEFFSLIFYRKKFMGTGRFLFSLSSGSLVPFLCI